jgi:hypothetical protein
MDCLTRLTRVSGIYTTNVELEKRRKRRKLMGNTLSACENSFKPGRLHVRGKMLCVEFAAKAASSRLKHGQGRTGAS